jgi:C4-dicarboxylate-binding protein DctP
MQKVQSDLSLTAHGYLGYAVVTHQRFWENLPSADRRLVQGALDEALILGNEIADAQNNKALLELQRTATLSIHRPTAAQTRQLQQASRQVRAELAARIGQDWLTTVQNALDKVA